eukprot:SAG31_NODE_2947_length_4873_cov_8.636364_1_plen_81_part_00
MKSAKVQLHSILQQVSGALNQSPKHRLPVLRLMLLWQSEARCSALQLTQMLTFSCYSMRHGEKPETAKLSWFCALFLLYC